MEELAVSLNLVDGRTVRFGGDEADPADVPYNISWDTQIPGGFGAAQITLSKPASLYADDARLFSDVVIYGKGGRTLYEGYVTAVPQVGAQEIQLECSGWSSVLERIQTFSEVFVDRDLARWEGPSNDRKTGLLTIGIKADGPQTEWDQTTPALVLSAENGTVNPFIEAYLDCGPGNTVHSVYYDVTSTSTSSYVGEIGSVRLGSGVHISNVTSDFLTGTNSSAAGTFTPTAQYRYGFVQFSLTGTVSGGDKRINVRNLAVYGNHGLTLRGSDPKGVAAEDVLGYVIAQSPLSNDVSQIESTIFVIPHLSYPEDVSLRQVIEDVTAYGGSQNTANDWGVYENKQFFWRPPGTGRTWRVRRDQTATATSEGPDADMRTAGVKVLYQDFDGSTKSVGPLGSNSDFETDDLLDADPDNPARRIPGAFAVEQVGITTQEGAVNIGKLILNERNRLVWRGSVELQGEVTDENGNPYPVALVRAGDQIVIEDDADTTPKPIQSTSYNHASMSLSANVGARPDTLEALLGRLAAVTDLFGS